MQLAFESIFFQLKIEHAIKQDAINLLTKKMEDSDTHFEIEGHSCDANACSDSSSLIPLNLIYARKSPEITKIRSGFHMIA